MTTNPRVYICHCHDDRSPGKTIGEGPDAWSERSLARAVNEAVTMYLREEGLGAYPVFAGTLASRIGILQGLPPGPVVEVHFDSLPQRTEVAGYFAIVASDNYAAQDLGGSILDAMAGAFPERRSLGLCRADEQHRWVGTPREHDGQRLGLLAGLPGRPVAIVEACFLTNPSEAKWIRRLENRLLLGIAIGRGVSAHLARFPGTEPPSSPA